MIEEYDFRKEYRIGNVFKYKNCYLRVEENESFTCEKCFFYVKNYIYEKLTDCITCCKQLSLCSSFFRLDNKEIIYKRLSEIEELILKGSD